MAGLASQAEPCHGRTRRRSEGSRSILLLGTSAPGNFALYMFDRLA